MLMGRPRLNDESDRVNFSSEPRASIFSPVFHSPATAALWPRDALLVFVFISRIFSLPTSSTITGHYWASSHPLLHCPSVQIYRDQMLGSSHIAISKRFKNGFQGLARRKTSICSRKLRRMAPRKFMTVEHPTTLLGLAHLILHTSDPMQKASLSHQAFRMVSKGPHATQNRDLYGHRCYCIHCASRISLPPLEFGIASNVHLSCVFLKRSGSSDW